MLNHAGSQVVRLSHIQTRVMVGTEWEVYLKQPVNRSGIAERLQRGEIGGMTIPTEWHLSPPILFDMRH